MKKPCLHCGLIDNAVCVRHNNQDTDAGKLEAARIRIGELRVLNAKLVRALRLLVNDVAYALNDDSWTIGPCKDIPTGRLALAREALADAEKAEKRAR